MHYQAITPRVWHIEEDYRDYCTLVRGDRLAILWDTGQGKGDLPAFLAEHGCRAAQGMYFAPPLPKEAFEAFLREHQ